MKFKSIISCGLLLLGVGAATTSCKDMFTPDNNIVTTELAPQDTVFQAMGIVQRMQKLADRTVLLGELRGDLVSINREYASPSLQQIFDNNVDVNNDYNKPRDYYDVINNCNIYLAYVDSTRRGGTGKEGSTLSHYFGKEICAAKTFRAWCYLELAKIYGEVPFVTEPVTTANAGSVIAKSAVKSSLSAIADYLIDDLQSYAFERDNLDMRPGYSNKNDYAKYFIPVRVMLAELYLWRGSITNNQSDYINAARLYHDFLVFPGEEQPVGANNAFWLMESSLTGNSILSTYSGSFNYSETVRDSRPGWLKNAVAVIPMDTIAFYGNYSDLHSIFNSATTNNYFPVATYSDRLLAISQGQTYCYVSGPTGQTSRRIIIFDDKTKSEGEYSSPILRGDLRLSQVISSEPYNNMYDKSKNDEKICNAKYAAAFNGSQPTNKNDQRIAAVPYYRYTTLYLHMAEALNRAGFPETAFAVLKYGLSYENLANEKGCPDYISPDEYNRLASITMWGGNPDYTIWNFSNASLNNTFLYWPTPSATTDVNKPYGQNMTAIAPAEDYFSLSGNGGSVSLTINQSGIHTLGSGDSRYNTAYVLPVDSSCLSETERGYKKPTALTDKDKPKDKDPEDKWNAYYEKVKLYNDSVAHYQANVIKLSKANRASRQAFVAQRILDEEALENCFEGTRFYDLMRYAMQEGKYTPSTVSYPEYIDNLYKADRKIQGSWYIPFPY